MSPLVAAPGERPLSRSCRGCRRNEWRSEIPSPFRVISSVCEEENFPPWQRRHPKRSLSLTGHDPDARHPAAHPSGAARLCDGWADERFARRRQILGVRAFRSHTISGHGFSLLELLRCHFRGGRRRLARARSLAGGGASDTAPSHRCTISCGPGASGAIPFPGADSIFSSLCGAICGRLRLGDVGPSHGAISSGASGATGRPHRRSAATKP
jgi:hypothetical protein